MDRESDDRDICDIPILTLPHTINPASDVGRPILRLAKIYQTIREIWNTQ